jgi:hypothetical protein
MIGQRDLAFYRGNDDQALEDYNEAIRLVGAANAYYNRGLVYYNSMSGPLSPTFRRRTIVDNGAWAGLQGDR